ncbi:unnamed protein product [Aphanomyces euteiches]|uniref:VASt domain-containing protein n=1 Tax=Aphanomyces euteiches TaxID=100861 RepID=A0A6G0XJA3_9STRA|nr:hypothetical protein Ae201684_004293 [Aphanomyces euteiches]KAH9094418.1 hypothetical protein Ae201684P_017026 [Aphanomyces euteiches]KAH9147848.1 hypothetical protein AeRB84_008626 [Aphanomyces euteiches]KAH9153145.1 hypothetical protein AeRB84_004538 [Aphanomyces euteiches]
MKVKQGHVGGIAMGAVLGMFWMRVVLGFSYLQIVFFMIFPLSFTIVVVMEERSLGPAIDLLLVKVRSLVWMAMHADDPTPPPMESTVDPFDETCHPRPSDPVLDAELKMSNTSDLITSANSSLFAGIHMDLIDHSVVHDESVYLQDTATGLFLKYADGKIKLTATPDEACLFEWIKGKTHHWGLVSKVSQKFIGQNMLSQIIATAKKLQNWEAFRVLQDATSPTMQNDLSAPIYMILCSSRFGKGMWLTGRGRDEDKHVVGLSKNFNFAVRLRYSSQLAAFHTALSPEHSPVADIFPTSFQEAAEVTPILTKCTFPPSPRFDSLSLFADAYDTLLPEHHSAWQVRPALGNVRYVTYPLHHLGVGCLAHEFHCYDLVDNLLWFRTKLILGPGLVPNFAFELTYQVELTATAVVLDCTVGVHWVQQPPSMFESYVKACAEHAAGLHAKHLVALMEHQTAPRVVTNLATLFVTSLHNAFDSPTYELNVPWNKTPFFSASLTPVYSGAWPISPETYLERMLSDAAWFFRVRDELSRPTTLDMSPWSLHPTLGHVRVHRFTTCVGGRDELVEEYQTYSSPEPNTLQFGRKLYLAHRKQWTVDIRWDFEQQDESSSVVATAVAFHWATPRADHADVEKHVTAVITASIERLHVLVTSQEELENMPWPDQLTAPIVRAMCE